MAFAKSISKWFDAFFQSPSQGGITLNSTSLMFGIESDETTPCKQN